jgi:hypothetical protein
MSMIHKSTTMIIKRMTPPAAKDRIGLTVGPLSTALRMAMLHRTSIPGRGMIIIHMARQNIRVTRIMRTTGTERHGEVESLCL